MCIPSHVEENFHLSTPHYCAWGNADCSLVDPVETYAVTSGSIEQWYERNCTQIPAKRSLDGSKQTKFHSSLSARKVCNFSASLKIVDLSQTLQGLCRFHIWECFTEVRRQEERERERRKLFTSHMCVHFVNVMQITQSSLIYGESNWGFGNPSHFIRCKFVKIFTFSFHPTVSRGV